MAFLKTLIKLISPKDQPHTNDPMDHFTALEQLRLNHEWIEVKVTKTDLSYQSLILNLDIENNELLIDELFPPEHIEKIEPGDTVAIRSQSSQKPINFFSRVLAREFSNGSGLWRLELPDGIGHNGNRNAFRVYVENDLELDIEVYTDGEPLNDVRIVNISTEGLKLSFSQAHQDQLHNNKSLERCIIRLPGGFDVDCDIMLSNIYSIRTPVPHLLAGGKLTIDNPQHRVKLQQYIASIQRRQRRRESRVV